MFCGYACVVYGPRRVRNGGALHRVRDRARYARPPHRAADRHHQRVRRAVRLARRHHFLRHRPAILAFSWGLGPLGRLGWAAGFLFVAAAAMRLRASISRRPAAATSVIRRDAQPGGRGHSGGDCLCLPVGCPTTGRRCRRSRWCSCGAADGQHDSLRAASSRSIFARAAVDDPDRHRRSARADHDASPLRAGRDGVRYLRRRLSAWRSPACGSAHAVVP